MAQRSDPPHFELVLRCLAAHRNWNANRLDESQRKALIHRIENQCSRLDRLLSAHAPEATAANFPAILAARLETVDELTVPAVAQAFRDAVQELLATSLDRILGQTQAGADNATLHRRALSIVFENLEDLLPGLRWHVRSSNHRVADTNDGVANFATRTLEAMGRFEGRTWIDLRQWLWTVVKLMKLESYRKASKHSKDHKSQGSSWQLQPPIADTTSNSDVTLSEIQAAIPRHFSEEVARRLAAAVICIRENMDYDQVAVACKWTTRTLMLRLRELAEALGLSVDLCDEEDPPMAAGAANS